MRPLLALVMIVKNEANNIEAVIDSVQGVVDHITILDTGSTDDTTDIIRVAAKDIPVSITMKPFVTFAPLLPEKTIIDFAATRNLVLDLEESREDAAEFNLMMSGDEVLSAGAALREFLESRRAGVQNHPTGDALGTVSDAYCIEMHGGSTRWLFPRILRTGAGRRYVNPVHEVPIGKNNETSGPVIPGVTITHTVSDKERRFDRMKNCDVPVLTYVAEDPKSTPEQKARAISFLAQTYESLAEEYPNEPGSARLSWKMLAMSCYRRRVELGGNAEDTNYAAFHYLAASEAIGFYNDWELLERLGALMEMDPKRPETRFMIANHAGVQDPKKGLFLALDAARVAKEAKENPLHLPFDDRMEWMSLRIAAACAKELKKSPTYIQELVAKAIAAGGTPEELAPILAA